MRLFVRVFPRVDSYSYGISDSVIESKNVIDIAGIYNTTRHNAMCNIETHSRTSKWDRKSPLEVLVFVPSPHIYTQVRYELKVRIRRYQIVQEKQTLEFRLEDSMKTSLVIEKHKFQRIKKTRTKIRRV